MNEHDKKLLEIRQKNEAERKRMLNEATSEAPLTGKELFNLQELKKYWSFRYEHTSTQDQIDRAMQEVERDYYLAGKRFMAIEQYGKHLMEMELYR